MLKLARFYILLSWSLFVFILLTFPTPPYDGTVISWHDKVVHMVMFGVMAYLVSYLLAAYPRISLFWLMAAGALVSAGYSALGEYVQGYVPGRTQSVYDFYAGVAGILVSLIFTYAKFRKKT